METVQRQVIKWFRRDRSPSSPNLSSCGDPKADRASWLKKRRTSAPGSPKMTQDGNESDSAKYWTSAKTRRKLKHLAARRELPPLPPGAKAGTPDIFRHSPIRFGRGVESPSHIYEEIPSWALDVSLDIACHDKDSLGSSASALRNCAAGLTSPLRPQLDSTDRNRLDVTRAAGSQLPNSMLLHTNSQLVHDTSHPSNQVQPKSQHSYAEINASKLCSSGATGQQAQNDVDLLNVPAVTAKTEEKEAHRKNTPGHKSRQSVDKESLKSPFDSPSLGKSHSSHHLPKRLPSGNTQLDSMLELGIEPLQDLDQLDIPVQDSEDFLTSSRDNLCGADDPTAVYRVKEVPKVVNHVHDDSIDGCYEYDINSSNQTPNENHRRSHHKHSRNASGASASATKPPDHQASPDKGSFRSYDGSHGKSESSNDTFSEYDIKSDTSGCDYEVEYEYILSKIRDNLRLKENVQKLASKGSQQSVTTTDSATLTSVSSLSEISTLADDEIKRLLASSKSSLTTSQYSLTSSDRLEHPHSKHIVKTPQESSSEDTAIADDESDRSCAKEKRQGATSKVKLKSNKGPASSTSLATKSEPVHRRAGSVSCISKEDDNRLSCRVSTLKAESVYRTKPQKAHRRHSGQSNNGIYNIGNNRLLADIMQRNHDRQTLFL